MLWKHFQQEKIHYGTNSLYAAPLADLVTTRKPSGKDMMSNRKKNNEAIIDWLDEKRWAVGRIHVCDSEKKSHRARDESVAKPKCDENNPYLKECWKCQWRKHVVGNNHSQGSHLCSTFQIRHPHCLRTHVDVSRLCNLMTHLNWFYPSMCHHILNRWPVFRIGFQHLAKEAATSSGI